MSIPPQSDYAARRARAFVPARDRLLVGEEDAAELLDVSVPTFRAWVRAGLIQPIEVPLQTRRKLYRVDDLREAIERLPVAEGADQRDRAPGEA